MTATLFPSPFFEEHLDAFPMTPASCCLVAAGVTYWFRVETRGRSLESVSPLLNAAMKWVVEPRLHNPFHSCIQQHLCQS